MYLRGYFGDLVPVDRVRPASREDFVFSEAWLAGGMWSDGDQDRYSVVAVIEPIGGFRRGETLFVENSRLTDDGRVLTDAA